MASANVLYKTLLELLPSKYIGFHESYKRVTVINCYW